MLLNRSALDAFDFSVFAAFARGLATADSQYKKIAMVVPSSNAANVYPWLGALPSMRQWVGERIVRNLKVQKYTIENEKFELTIAVQRDHLEDDQWGIYEPMFEDMAAECGRHPNRLIFAALQKGHESVCYDGHSFFAEDHPVGDKSVSNNLGNGSATPWYLMCTARPVKPMIFQVRRDYQVIPKDQLTDDHAFMRDEFLYGVDARVNVGYGLWQCAIRSTEPLHYDSYADARAAMRAFTNEEGDPLGLAPDMLVVPTSLEAAARNIIVSPFGLGGRTNPWAGSAELLVSPWLA